jgi:hypothetical protein
VLGHWQPLIGACGAIVGGALVAVERSAMLKQDSKKKTGRLRRHAKSEMYIRPLQPVYLSLEPLDCLPRLVDSILTDLPAIPF